MSVYRRAFAYFRPYHAQTAAALALTLLGIGFNLLKPWPFKWIVDGILQEPTSPSTLEARQAVTQWFGTGWPAIAWLCTILVAVSILWGVLNLAANYLFIRVGLEALLQLRTNLYACLQSLPLRYHDERRSTDSSFRVAYDSQAIQTIYNKGFASIFTAGITVVAALAVMFTIDVWLTLVSIAILPFVTLAIRHYATRIRNESTTIHERESDLLTLAQEGLNGIRMVQAFNRQDFEIRQFRERATQSLQANMKLNVTSVVSGLIVGVLMAVGTALLYAVGSAQVLNGSLTLGDLLVFASYLVMLYQPAEQLSYTAWALEGAAAGAQRCFEVLDREDEIRDSPGATPITAVKGSIAFRDVSFAYSPDQPILSDIHVEIFPGESVAFVGGTGAGKSTLLSLVPRFYDPTGGVVEMDGHDLRTLTKQSVRAQVSMVLQDTLLFSTSIRENIAYGRPDATEEEIFEAARRAEAFDFISRMPQGFDSSVGERGGHLSVGQRQRIGIARAFLKNAPILLLDEPTSALDAGTERSIMDTIAGLMKGRTTLIITHRLSTVHHLDRIVVLKLGRIAEQGTGPELLRLEGEYARLHAAAGERR